jgi:tyrosyl-tRNA synthetase
LKQKGGAFLFSRRFWDWDPGALHFCPFCAEIGQRNRIQRSQKKENEKMGVYEELQARGLIAQVTNEEEIRKMVNEGKAVFYIGFDPTADSLHVGHFMALCLMKRLQMAGNKPIALIGGGTGMVGDPSGRSDMRQMMTVETIQHNCDCFKKQMSRFIDFSDGKAMMVNNAEWLLDLNYVDFLREIGPHFSVNRMLTAECYKQRMEKGLSFLEFNYMLMQSYDFYELFQRYGCNMQFGGDDQWSNMLGGTELIRRKLGKDAHAMTITLLLNSEGKKMGKTQSGAVWLDPNKTSPFEFYQYWRNIADADVLKCLRMLTFLPLEQIDEMDKWEGSQLNEAKEILAYELTALVHGDEEAKKAQESARALFAGGNAAEMPTAELSDDDFTDGAIDILSIVQKSGLCGSRSEARRNVEQGGVSVDGEAVKDIKTVYTKEQLSGDGIVVKRGKKNFRRVTVK